MRDRAWPSFGDDGAEKAGVQVIIHLELASLQDSIQSLNQILHR